MDEQAARRVAAHMEIFGSSVETAAFSSLPLEEQRAAIARALEQHPEIRDEMVRHNALFAHLQKRATDRL